MLRAIALIVLAMFGATGALPDEGEVGLAAAVGLEGTTARHPKGLPDVAALNVSPALVAAVGVDYGVSNVLDAGLGLEAAFAGNVTTPGASVSGAEGDLVTGLVLDLRMPLALGVHLDTGLPVSAGLVLEAGPSLTLWSSSVLVDPARKAAGGLPARLPITVHDEFGFGASVRLKLPLRMRLFDALSLVVEPHASVAWIAGPAVAVGFAVRPVWLPALGPL